MGVVFWSRDRGLVEATAEELLVTATSWGTRLPPAAPGREVAPSDGGHPLLAKAGSLKWELVGP